MGARGLAWPQLDTEWLEDGKLSCEKGLLGEGGGGHMKKKTHISGILGIRIRRFPPKQSWQRSQEDYPLQCPLRAF